MRVIVGVMFALSLAGCAPHSDNPPAQQASRRPFDELMDTANQCLFHLRAQIDRANDATTALRICDAELTACRKPDPTVLDMEKDRAL
jgi:hypothetical protein